MHPMASVMQKIKDIEDEENQRKGQMAQQRQATGSNGKEKTWKNRRQGEMAQQRQRATTNGKENKQPSGSNGKEKNKVFMRPPPCLHCNDHLDMLNAVYDFESKHQREGLPVENFVQHKIETCRALQNVGENISEQYLIGKIVDLLSPSWMHVKRTMFQRHVIENATH